MELIIAIVGVIGSVVAAIIGNYRGRTKRADLYKKVEAAMDDLTSLLRDRVKAGESTSTAMQLFLRLRATHEMDLVIAAFYMLRERRVIEWGAQILKPESNVELLVQ